MTDWAKKDFESDILHAAKPSMGLWTWIFLFVLVLFFVSAGLWAKNSTLEELTRGEGRIVPFGKVQIVQSLEGGIVKSIHVAVGQKVSQGDILLNIDDTNFSASVEEIDAREKALRSKIARLNAELSGRNSINFPEGLLESAPDVIASETRLFKIRRNTLYSEVNVLTARQEQREMELQELVSTERNLNRELVLAKDELRLNQSASDLVPEAEMIRIRREVSRLTGEIDVNQSNQMQAKAAIREASSLISKERTAFREEAQTELTESEANLSVILAGSKAADDRVERAGLRAPVDGIVNAIHVNTLGGVVQPGSDLIEIIPYGGTIQIEAKISPKDVGFLALNQPAKVKITAYDYSIYGGLDGYVERIGADSLTDEITGETYFPIDIVADASNFKNGDERLSVSPGMVASVDIITGNKSILQYILKPINKARYEAMRER